MNSTREADHETSSSEVEEMLISLSETQSIAENTFISSIDASDDVAMLLDERDRRSSKSNKRWNQSKVPNFLRRRFITLRSTLLAFSLSLTLLVFWLLDSIKDATFAALVDGNLRKHQPLAKMTSVGCTLIIVIMMEVVSHERKRRMKAREEMNDMSDDVVQSGGGRWTRMDFNDDTDNSEDNGADLISTNIFRIVGFAYVAIFAIISHALKYHHGFSGNDDEYRVSTSTGWYILGYVQYMMIESFGSIGVATFWSFTNSTLSLKAAKMFYGFIIAGAQLGALSGATLATFSFLSIPTMFTFSSVGILLQVGIMEFYGRKFPFPMNNDDDLALSGGPDLHDFEAELALKARKRRNVIKDEHESKESNLSTEGGDDLSSGIKAYLSGVFLILKHHYLLLIFGVSCLYEISLTCLDYEMKLMGLDRFRAPSSLLQDSSQLKDSMSEEAANSFATFMGRYGQLTNLLSLILSYFAFPYLMESYGLKQTLRIFPTILVIITMIVFVALPMNLSALFISMSLLKALTYSINDPAKEILYIPTSNTVKFKAKFWIDVVGARVAKAIGSSINTYAGTAERIVQYGSLPSVASSIALWVICFAAGQNFESLLESGEIVGVEDDERSNFGQDHGNMDDDLSYDPSEDNFRSGGESGWESNVSIELISARTSSHRS